MMHVARIWRHLLPSAAGLVAGALALWLGAAAAVGQDGAKGGKAVPPAASAALEEAYGYVKDKVKPPPDTLVLAAQGTPEGQWRFVNQAGELFTVGTRDEMKRVVTVLYPEAKAGAPLVLYLTDDTALGKRGKLRALPADAEKHIVVGGKSYGLLPLRGDPQYVALHAHVAIELRGEPQILKSALQRLDRPLAEAGVRLLTLERSDQAHIEEALAGPGGQTLVLCAGGAGDLIYVGSGSLPVGELIAAADNANVTLILLQLAASERAAPASCPNGGRLPAELTLGDILEAAALQSRQAPVAIAVAGDLGALGATVIGDLVTGTIRLEEARRWQPGRRLIGDLPFPVPAVYIALVLLGWLGTPVARRLWGNSLWSAGKQSEYASLAGYWAARTLGFLVFALVFQPATAVVTAPLNLIPQIWRAFMGPVRVWGRVFGRAATAR